jgi:hypothetical protein
VYIHVYTCIYIKYMECVCIYIHAILIYITRTHTHTYICVRFINVLHLLEDDQDRSKHVGVSKNCAQRYKFNSTAFVGTVV